MLSSNMKSTFAYALLLSCLAVCLAMDKMEAGRQLIVSCMTENGVTEQDVNNVKSGDTKMEDVKDNVKCATQCVLAKLNFMNSKGVLQQDKVAEYFKDGPLKEQAAKAMETCGSVTGANPCDTAFQMMVCIDNNVTDIMKV